MRAAMLVVTLVLAVLAGLMLADQPVARIIKFGGGNGPISSVAWGTPFQYNGNSGTGAGAGKYMDGDTFGNTWSNDGNTYTLVNDQGQVQGTASSSNIGFGKISAPFDSTAVWTKTNPMSAWGTQGDFTGSDGPGGASSSFKSGGLISIANILYTATWRIASGSTSSYNGQLIQSSDHGANWIPVPPAGALPYTTPGSATGGTVMWPGNDKVIGWVQYGQNYACSPPIDNCNSYVYAIFNAYPPGGTNLNQRLGRVKLSLIANMSAADWSYYQGGDGMLDASWLTLAQSSTALSGAPKIYPDSTDPNTSLTIDGPSIQYLPRYGQYVAFRCRTLVSSTYIWDVLTASHPWGPWTIIGVSPQWSTNQQLGFPFIAPQSLTNNGQSLVVMASSSNYNSGCTPASGYYCLYLVPITFIP
jgi:hypothetical protein